MDNELKTAKPGTILHSCWGYNMTIVDFYKIVSNNGKTVVMERLGKSHTGGDGCGQFGHCVPAPGKGETIRRRFNKWGGLKGYYDSEYLSIWDGKPCYFNYMD